MHTTSVVSFNCTLHSFNSFRPIYVWCSPINCLAVYRITFYILLRFQQKFLSNLHLKKKILMSCSWGLFTFICDNFHLKNFEFLNQRLKEILSFRAATFAAKYCVLMDWRDKCCINARILKGEMRRTLTFY